jgi:hypothetical protein
MEGFRVIIATPDNKFVVFLRYQGTQKSTNDENPFGCIKRL